MTVDELDVFLDNNKNIKCGFDDETDSFAFRDENLDWYKNDENRCTKIRIDILENMDCKELMGKIIQGLKIEGISRITGYFSKVNSWNPGKRGELRDRHKTDLTGKVC